MNDKTVRAWSLVDAYAHSKLEYMDEGEHKRRLKRLYTGLDRAAIAPIGALMRFERERQPQRLSYNRASNYIASRLPKEYPHPPITHSTIHKMEQEPSYTATDTTLEQLCYAFGWEMAWLKVVNRESYAVYAESEASPLVQQVCNRLHTDPDLAPLFAMIQDMGGVQIMQLEVFARNMANVGSGRVRRTAEHPSVLATIGPNN